MGIVAPNGTGLPQFTDSIKHGVSGIKYDKELEALGFSCRISGKPEISETIKMNYFTELELRGFNSTGITYGVIAGMDAWKDAGLEINNDPDWDAGIIFGACTSGIDKFRESIYTVDQLQVRRLGSNTVMQTMNSGISAYLAGKLGLGNQVTTNSSACATGTESIIMAYEQIRNGKALRMLAGSTSDSGPYIWAGFDAMRVCDTRHNDAPQKGSRPMSATACGFVPGSGAGAMVLEELETALARGTKIYGEIIGGYLNAGGQRDGGTMTSPNNSAVRRCITGALKDAAITGDKIDAINGHLTATIKDSTEIENWTEALGRNGEDFPYINSLKSMTGHCLAGAGSIECVASVLQVSDNFIFPNINCTDLNPEITALISNLKIPFQLVEKKVDTVIKASFGFGDVNACIVFSKFKNRNDG